ncbi:NrfD/PsrC family molybdoenzyme membrane anchor subunit [Sulfolobus acidocaldarius]|uniref:Polysulphide reductase n=4 Tax=Sulfolobus acidocaldarius TaxID=2285 RepID=Q4J729_SULAC|nr:NrfD/PsrC family molybdoenzyme membrane anchor subunit [Sulfolobus acidocaldarius]AAY81403.1 polysulphide reductase [Sulfolobus acidocaldarius DSM 639]AGE72002.1 polysulfide reductase [Sulfolobus acidocaldarius N8]AGE74318.1 polysulfide reductase [Sulfolobus acidocaldarius Ron12/I]ALU29804.1 nitrite reductase [Sulfolobus acidocaldarius]ALU32543.1 nitrite reductase [Sulfolobus acidocaldarius]
MGLFTAPAPGTNFGINSPLLQINQYPEWDVTVALALYFTGLAGMLMAITSILEFTGRYPSLVKRNSIFVFIFAVLSLVAFDIHLGVPIRGFYAPANAFAALLNSWMARGIEFVGGLLVFSLIFMAIKVLDVKNVVATWVFAILGLVAGIFSTTYSGFELSAATGVPFWNNGGLPALFLASGIVGGSAWSYIISLVTKGEEGIRARRLTAKLLAYSAVAELATWFLFMANVNFVYVFNEVAYNYMISAVTFVIDLALLGLAFVVPGVGNLMMWRMLRKTSSQSPSPSPIDFPNYLKIIILVVAILALVSGFFTREDILFAGQYAYQVAPLTPFQYTNGQPTPIGAFGWRS